MDTIDKILSLMDAEEISAYELSREAGISNGLITQWKQRKQKPSMKNLKKIAEYFGIPLNFFLEDDYSKPEKIVRNHILEEKIEQVEAIRSGLLILNKKYNEAVVAYKKAQEKLDIYNKLKNQEFINRYESQLSLSEQIDELTFDDFKYTKAVNEYNQAKETLHAIENEIKSIPSATFLEEPFYSFLKLNKSGQKKVTEYIDDLIATGNYNK